MPLLFKGGRIEGKKKTKNKKLLCVPGELNQIGKARLEITHAGKFSWGYTGGSFCARCGRRLGAGGGRGYSLQGEGVVVPAGLAVPDKVAALLTKAQQVLSVAPADGSVIPSAERDGVRAQKG